MAAARPEAILGVWLLGGLYLLVSAFSVAELATAVPHAGGFYAYTRRAFGDAAGFTAGWVDWLTQSAAVAYLGVSMAEFSGALWPVLAGHTTACAVALVAMLGGLQWIGTRSNGRAQQITCAVQAVALMGLLAAFFLAPRAAAPAVAAAAPYSAWAGLALALRLVVPTFDGWYCSIYFTEEIREPERNLPRSIIGGVALITLVYLLVNAALLRVLPVGVLAGSTFPVADAAVAVFGGTGGKLVTLVCLISLPGAFHSGLLCATRISYAMGRDGLFGFDSSPVNRRGTPGRAMAASAVAGAVMAASGSFERLLTWVGILNYATYCAALAAVVVLRRREPGLPRPFAVRPFPWLTVAALAGGAVLLAGAVAADLRSTLEGLALVAAGYPVFVLSRWVRRRTTSVRR
jgi:APA family basic amino acid/polyamine antiporter